MANQNNGDFYGKFKWHAFQIVSLIIFLYVLYKVLKAEVPFIP